MCVYPHDGIGEGEVVVQAGLNGLCRNACVYGEGGGRGIANH